MNEIRRALTPVEAAVRLGVHVNTVKRKPPSELPYWTINARGDRRYDPDVVERYVLERTRAA